MNEVLKAIEERRSVRKFRAEMVPAETVGAIVRAGLFAASGMGHQSPIILVVRNKELRERLRKMNARIGGWAKDFDPFYGAPVILVVLAEKNWPQRVYDGSLVMGNLMLAASALGVGSCWIHRAREEFEGDEGKAILAELGVQGEYEGIGHCALGYAAGAVPPAAPRKAGRVFYAD
jgi:nitroreductase